MIETVSSARPPSARSPSIRMAGNRARSIERSIRWVNRSQASEVRRRLPCVGAGVPLFPGEREPEDHAVLIGGRGPRSTRGPVLAAQLRHAIEGTLHIKDVVEAVLAVAPGAGKAVEHLVVLPA